MKRKTARPHVGHQALLEALQKLEKTVDLPSVTEGWIPWEDENLEGVVRCCASGDWEILADPRGEFDRCANAEMRYTLREPTERWLKTGFAQIAAGAV